ncbi:hypothetical protein [Neglectibacter timonensis]|nr:hypothetical protein [Neglectibacter timonensis]
MKYKKSFPAKTVRSKQENVPCHLIFAGRTLKMNLLIAVGMAPAAIFVCL